MEYLVFAPNFPLSLRSFGFKSLGIVFSLRCGALE